MNTCVVSISCITYNQAPFIRECLDSFLMQKTSFAFEIIIHDDASTDGTKEIIEEYVAKYPDIIFPMYQKENQYSKGVRGMMAKYNFPRCRGKYIALCEGDDYWTDPLKLQKQVDFLEKNEGYNYCGHKSFVRRKDEIKKIPLEISDFGFSELIFQNFLNTSALVFRKSSVEILPKFLTRVSAGDWALQLTAIKDSKAYVLTDYMSIYREHENGVWSTLDNKSKCLQGVKTQEAVKILFTDKKSVSLINDAIKERKKLFGIVEHSFFKKLLIKIKFKILKF